MQCNAIERGGESYMHMRAFDLRIPRNRRGIYKKD